MIILENMQVSVHIYLGTRERHESILTPADSTSCNQSFISRCPNIGNTCPGNHVLSGRVCPVQFRPYG